MNSEVEIDETDVKILEALIRDARTNLKDIAKDCGLSSTAVLRRVAHLKTTGVIVGTTLFIDASLLGYMYNATFGVSLEHDQEPAVSMLIRERAHLVVLSQSVGKYDLFAFVLAKGIDEIDSVKQAIRRNPGVKKIAVNIWSSKPYFLFENLIIKPTRTGELH